MSRIRSKDTPPEMMVRRLVHKMGVPLPALTFTGSPEDASEDACPRTDSRVFREADSLNHCTSPNTVNLSEQTTQADRLLTRAVRKRCTIFYRGRYGNSCQELDARRTK